MNDSRPAGGLETYSVVRHYLKRKGLIVVGADFDQVLTRSNLFPALARLVETEPILSANVYHDHLEGPYEFRKLASVDLDRIVTFGSQESRAQVTTRVMAQQYPFNVDLPQWRLEVFGQGRSVALSYDHTMSDGMGGAYFIKKLVEFLNEVPSAMSGGVVACTEPLRPCVEDCVDTTPSWIYWLHKKAQSFIGPAATPTTGLDYVIREPEHVTATYHDFTTDEVSQMLSLCRSHGFTIAGLFFALEARARLKLELTADPSTVVDIDAAFGVNMRPMLEPQYAEAIGDYYAMYHFNHSVVAERIINSDEAFYEFARSVSSELRQFRTGTERSCIYDMHGHKDYWAKLRKMDGQRASTVLNVSSLGALPHNKQQFHTKVTTAWFAQHPTVGGPRVVVSLHGVRDGPTSFSVTALFDRDRLAERVRDMIVEMVDGFVKGN